MYGSNLISPRLKVRSGQRVIKSINSEGEISTSHLQLNTVYCKTKKGRCGEESSFHFQVKCFCSLAPKATRSCFCVYLCVFGVSVYLRALLLQADQLSLVQVCSTGVHLRQLSVRVHQLLHRLLWNALPDGGVDALHCLQHCTRDMKRHA